ncbi:hypothetical protein EUX98_g3381 [Antrodiella citrinella]|uniref:Aldehyde dehydrogenase domain-containing protein n=1 Tax=Antrodiella citrinella TaxID=2447956 RepID=A0A4S4MZG0_9APHY|nr:hypothetical protein EUX98_g3381 [Antrodiella citrinella]
MASINDTIPFTGIFIDGKSRPASDNRSFEARNPHSGKVVGLAASATSDDCRAAIESAGKAFKTWEKTTLYTRRAVFLKAANLLETDRYQEKIMTSTRDETGASDGWRGHNIDSAIQVLRDVAGFTSLLKGEVYPSRLPGGQVIVERRPKGVIFAISPWNVPVLLSVRAVAVPILCGNTAILKCSEISPRSQSIVAELFTEAGLPDGVLNFISMDRKDAPKLTNEIIAHPLVKSINFTGSDVVGRILAGEAAKYLKPCVFELGGKAPAVVLDDADIVKAAKAIVSSVLLHSGQCCMSTERVIVQRKASETLIPHIVELMESFTTVDTNLDPKGLSGLFTEASAAKVVSLIEEARSEGAQLVVGDGTRQGNIIQPHVLVGCRPGTNVWSRESFGPVVVIAVAHTVDELIDLANATDYSLAASVWSGNAATAMHVARQIHSGVTNINGPTVHTEGMTHAGLGGASGYGHFDVAHFTDMRLVVVHADGPTSYPVVGTA